MKILRINSISGPQGGVESYINNITDRLDALGNKTLSITLSSVGDPNFGPNNIVLQTSPNTVSRTFHDIITDYSLFSKLSRIHEEFNPDLIHIHHFRIGFRSIYKFLMSVDTPVVFTAHDALAVCPLSTLVKPGNEICEGGVALRCGFTGCKIHSHLPYELMLSKSFKSLSRKRIKAFICPSYSIMRYLMSNGFSPVVHLPSFSSFEGYATGKTPNYSEILSRKTIGYIGRLEWYKGVDDLIRGFAIFAKTNRDYRLTIAGEGPFETNLKRLAESLGINSKVSWLGQIRREQKEEFYNEIVCNVVPSKYWENFALSAQESMLRGIPTIGTEIGGIPEIVQNLRTGFTVSISSPQEISRALQAITENKNDEVLEIMKSGHKFVLNNLTPEKNVMGLLDVYEKVLSGIPLTNGYDENNFLT